MTSTATTPQAYIDDLPDDRKSAMAQLRHVILSNLPKGFTETMNYGMLGYVVPHSLYPSGYHCKPETPLPFMNLASQKNHIAIYHMGIYANPSLMDWFITEYPNHCTQQLSMGKSCIRFKQLDTIPYELIGQLASKVSVNAWIELYESVIKKR